MIETLTNLYVCGSCLVVAVACLVWVVYAVCTPNTNGYRSPLFWPSVVLAAIMCGFGLWVLICGWPY
jgi:hypothetical protein